MNIIDLDRQLSSQIVLDMPLDGTNVCNSDENRRLFNHPWVVTFLRHKKRLFRAEKLFLSQHLEQLPRMNMLDIGVGAGRTTIHFAKLVKTYWGIDYCERMVAACRQRFSPLPENMSFSVCDVRSMSIFTRETFDIVLFSFNGIDYLPHEDRLKALGEIHRVTRSGGILFFSSHNIRSIGAPIMHKDPGEVVLRIANFFRLSLVGARREVLGREHATARISGLVTYFVAPEAQIAQLSAVGFSNIRVISSVSGKDLDQGEIERSDEGWLHYHCTA